MDTTKLIKTSLTFTGINSREKDIAQIYRMCS
jgi:hypothetical protein